MKKFILALFMLSIFACTKQDSNTLRQNETNNNNIVVENGVLAFSSYEQFFLTLNTLGSLSSKERIKWENDMGFVSIKTLYENFNYEIDQISALNAYDYTKKIAPVLEKYKDVIKETKESYEINCNGLLEAGILNKDALVKVGNDIIFFGADSIYTFPQQSLNVVKTAIKVETPAYNKSLNIINNSRVEEKEIFENRIERINPNTYIHSDRSPKTTMYLGSHSMKPGKLFTVTNQEWHVKTYPQDRKRKAYARLRMFNVATNDGVRGYLSIHLFVTKPNIFGKVRKLALDGITEGGQCMLSIRGSDPGIAYDHLINIQDPGPNELNRDPNVREIEFPIVVSNYFKKNSWPSSFGIDHSKYKPNAFYNCPNVINDSNNKFFGGYWKYIYTDSRPEHSISHQISNPIYVTITSSGRGPFSANQYNSGSIPLTNNEGSWE